jgi:hypothetical protein
MKTALGWIWFILIELVALRLLGFGWLVLLPLSIAKAWRYDIYRQVTYWRGGRWTWIWGNEEDGVTGPVWYMPGKPEWLRAYMWSAWRNSCNNLRYLVAWKAGPFWQKRFTFRGAPWYVQAGFRPDTGWPVLSGGTGFGSGA